MTERGLEALAKALGRGARLLASATVVVESGGDETQALRDLRRASQALRHAQELLQQSATNTGQSRGDGDRLAHEMRGVLSAIAGWAQLLRTKESDPATALRAGEIIERNAKALDGLLDQMTAKAPTGGGTRRESNSDRCA